MKVKEEVTAVLAESKCEGNLLFLPDVQLGRAAYIAVNKVLTALGGKWNRGKKAHVFDKDCGDIVEEVVLTGEYTDKKKEYQFFPTPPEIAKQLWELLDAEAEASVLEPSAGSGNILDAKPVTDLDITAIELMPENVAILRSKGYGAEEGNFLDIEVLADYIIANPPFTRQQDIDHVTHMIHCARKRVVSIMSPSWRFRTNRKTEEFKVLLNNYDHDWYELEEGAFKSSGTNIKTGILVVTL